MRFLGPILATGLVVVAIACGSDGSDGSGSDPCVAGPSKCSADAIDSATQERATSECRSILAGPCAAQGKASYACAASKQTCGADNKTDLAALVAACASERAALQSCLGTAGTDAGGNTGSDGSTPGTDSGSQDSGPTKSCCEQLAGSANVEWLATSGQLPTNVCPTWAVDESAATDPVITNGVLVIDTTSDGENVYYNHAAGNLAATPTSVVVIEAKVRLISGAAAAAWRSPAGLFARLNNGKKLVLNIEAGKIFLNSDENARGPEANVDTTTAAKTYRVEANLATNAVTVAVDGTPTLTGTMFTDPNSTANQIAFGEASSFAYGKSEWHSFKHNVYANCQ